VCIALPDACRGTCSAPETFADAHKHHAHGARRRLSLFFLSALFSVPGVLPVRLRDLRQGASVGTIHSPWTDGFIPRQQEAQCVLVTQFARDSLIAPDRIIAVTAIACKPPQDTDRIDGDMRSRKHRRCRGVCAAGVCGVFCGVCSSAAGGGANTAVAAGAEKLGLKANAPHATVELAAKPLPLVLRHQRIVAAVYQDVHRLRAPSHIIE